MKKLIVTIISAAATTLLTGTAKSQDRNASPSVVFFSAPSVNDKYYKAKFDKLISFYETCVATMHRSDFAVIVADKATYPILAKRIPRQHLLQGNARDIWIRDHGVICTNRGVFKTRYRPNYMTPQNAKWIEDGFLSYFNRFGIRYQNLNVKLDGGNFVSNGNNRAVITERILEDNKNLTEQAIRNLFKTQVGISQPAIVPEEKGDTTGHSDGMVKWLGENTIAVNQYDDQKFRKKVIDELTRTFPGIKIIDLVWNPTEKYWKDFADSSGVYVNAVTTPNAIYLPTYDLDTDARAIAEISKHSDRQVIPIRVSQDIAIMGGAARCLSMQLYGDPAAAFLEKQGIKPGQGEAPEAGGGTGWQRSFQGTYYGSVYDFFDNEVGELKLNVRSSRKISGRVRFDNRQQGNIRATANSESVFEREFWLSRRGGKAYIEGSFVNLPDAGVILEGSLETIDDEYYFELAK